MKTSTLKRELVAVYRRAAALIEEVNNLPSEKSILTYPANGFFPVAVGSLNSIPCCNAVASVSTSMVYPYAHQVYQNLMRPRSDLELDEGNGESQWSLWFGYCGKDYPRNTEARIMGLLLLADMVEGLTDKELRYLLNFQLP